MNGSELKEAREGMGLSQPAFAKAVNQWWSERDGEPSAYDQPRISNLERADRIPVKIQWFLAENGPIEPPLTINEMLKALDSAQTAKVNLTMKDLEHG